MAQKKYTQEFKDSTIQLALNSGEKIPKIAQDLDLHVKTLYAWINAYKRSNNIPTRAKKQFQEPNKKEIFEYIEFYYNRVRSHSYLGNLSPVKFEEKGLVLQNEMVA